jgi:ABC transport system ATP-binding/permease protein
MALLSLTDVELSFGGSPLLEGATVQFEPGERICIVGRNGTGKSTLLRLLNNEILPDAGTVWRQPGLTTAYLPQEVPDNLQGLASGVVAAGLGNTGQLLTAYQELAARIGENPTDELMAQLDSIQRELDSVDGWNLHERIERLMTDLKVPSRAHFEVLSGGQKRRVLLARAMASEPELLLLDEPTNHLDIATIDWLELYLRRYSGTLAMVSHDRMLMRGIASRVIDLDRGRLVSFACGFNDYLVRKEEALEVEVKQWESFDRKLASEEVWVRQGLKARRTRNEGRVRALQELRRQRAERRTQSGLVSMKLDDRQRSGDLIVECEEVSFTYPGLDDSLVTEFSTRIKRKDRIGILGPNGSGKTTLLRLLLGQQEPDRGLVKHGSGLQITYSDQLREELRPDATLLEAVSESREMLIVDGRPTFVLAYLKQFLFSPEQARQPVSALSGGERNRLLLARLFARPSNLLVLDEPTNDLDVETLELLESLLLNFKGTVLLVSHDREFLNNVVTSTLVMEGQGRVVEYAGGFDDWQRQQADAHNSRGAAPAKQKRPRTKPPAPPRLTFKQRAELVQLEAQIPILESERDDLFAQLAEPGFYKAQGDRVAISRQKISTLEAKLETAYSRWEELEDIRALSDK